MSLYLTDMLCDLGQITFFGSFLICKMGMLIAVFFLDVVCLLGGFSYSCSSDAPCYSLSLPFLRSPKALSCRWTVTYCSLCLEHSHPSALVACPNIDAISLERCSAATAGIVYMPLLCLPMPFSLNFLIPSSSTL